jgi:predicted nucleic acid-binding Zn ribbon protein
MNEKEIILSSYSIGDLTLKLFGYANAVTKEKTIKFLGKNGFSPNIFEGKNKRIKYERIKKECPVCKKEFETKKGHSKETFTCSIKCSNSLSPKRKKDPNRSPRKRIYSPGETKPKYHKECVICSSIFLGFKNTKTCSKECTSKLLKKKADERVLNGEHKGWTTRNISSYPEDFFKKVLNNLEIEFIFNFPVSKSSLGVRSSSSYFLDFYIQIGQRKIDLEIDGKQHEYSDRKESDQERDSLLIKNGYEVYRIGWKNPVNDKNKDYIKREIEKLELFLFDIIK